MAIPDVETESGLEEWILWVEGKSVITLDRADFESEWASNQLAYIAPSPNIVKAYAPADWQTLPYKPYWRELVIIGFRERRLTTEEENAIRDYVAQYWEIPF